MAETARTEYPAMLAYLQPSQAVNVLNDRVKRVSKLNLEIADWLQERRKVEEQYIQGLRRLVQFKVPNSASELGVESTAHSHYLFASNLEKDVEAPLRAFGHKKEHPKVDAAATRLSAASQEWESQAPFIFETLQVLDEQRTNQLRDLLTQLLTHESDQAQRNQTVAGEALQAVLDLQTPKEIENFSKKMTDGKAKQERRSAPATRRPSAAGSNLTPATATTAASHDEELQSEAEAPEPHQTPRLRSRIGTMLGRRRQSIHGGFGPLTQKSSSSFGRNLRSSHAAIPRGDPDTSNVNDVADSDEKPKDEPHEGTNGVKAPSSLGDLAVLEEAHDTVNGTDAGETTTAFAPPPGPPPAQAKDDEESQGKDSEGEAAAEEAEQLFKLNIQSTPVAEEDPEATQAALSNVSNALTQMGMPSRKTGTIRGRRDVRNTIYVPAPNGAPPRLVPARHLPLLIAGTSDTQSVRSGNSLGALNHAKHPDKLGPGLHASIIETITATFEEDAMKTAKISGEIAFCYNADEDPDYKSLHNPTIRINNFPASSGAQTKPSGTHLKEKHLVYWRLGDITLTSEPQKIVCRILGAEGAHPKPGHVEARWEYSPNESAVTSLAGISVSRLEESKGKEREAVLDEDPFADSDNLVSGKYETR
ncbi:unnamed protein product [Parascedosporium putredinis]|uniref:Muniscin C-terminal domain-containing protein n=1 Tax=Parascedosporium putredinis TaxID=1442378 RepID=A0A9P1H1F7_9PEZI|nr:unnamed protein product [Parascedosporium putredinis]CAI7995118.1 unnamed protein product [Parascedosporium putredinis]